MNGGSDNVFECYIRDTGSFHARTYLPELDKFEVLIGKYDDVNKNFSVEERRVMSLDAYTPYFLGSGEYCLLQSIQNTLSYLPCRAMPMYRSSGEPEISSQFDVYYHQGENKYWAITVFNGAMYVAFRNDITNHKWVLNHLEASIHSKLALTGSKENKGYKPFQTDVEFTTLLNI